MYCSLPLFKVYPYNHLYRCDEETLVKHLLSKYSHAEISQGISDQIDKTKPDNTVLRWVMNMFPLGTRRGQLVMSVAESILRIPDKAKKKELVAQMRLPLPNSLLVFLTELFIKYMGSTLIAGETVDKAKDGDLSSYDMLGESAITHEQSVDYMWKYREAVGKAEDEISVKLSSLSPVYTYLKQEECVPALVGILKTLMARGVECGVTITIDAEEQDKLDLSMMVIDQLAKDTNIKFNVAVQAYGKRAYGVIQYLDSLQHPIGVRLVKGAYWDTEIKLAQQGGLDYAVYTNKRHTNISYIACSKRILNSNLLTLSCASHNPSTIGAVKALGCTNFQRLYGMGKNAHKGLNSRVYKPVGSHKDLLAYLIRRMMENGANTSFIHHQALEDHRETAIVMKRHIALGGRRSTPGSDLSDPETIRRIHEARDINQIRTPNRARKNTSNSPINGRSS